MKDFTPNLRGSWTWSGDNDGSSWSGRMIKSWPTFSRSVMERVRDSGLIAACDIWDARRIAINAGNIFMCCASVIGDLIYFSTICCEGRPCNVKISEATYANKGHEQRYALR